MPSEKLRRLSEEAGSGAKSLERNTCPPKWVIGHLETGWYMSANRRPEKFITIWTVDKRGGVLSKGFGLGVAFAGMKAGRQNADLVKELLYIAYISSYRSYHHPNPCNLHHRLATSCEITAVPPDEKPQAVICVLSHQIISGAQPYQAERPVNMCKEW
ncbi:hypothetical protein K461DRAFT_266779 [Myriangium duriaei CBS 260.36]|uniref:Uncharacterized protein n=1 Tax=Myriangium duriaei CBS 260.36 TaxID=1168546 RepID=A0A9P4MHY9_9PEZI|nr:hypothetical protein K461DRAFT_266779 [Myriangium duriaei CBS 260.36]